MSYGAKRELLDRVAPRYREANLSQKSLILDEFIATTGYARKYAIRLLCTPQPAITPSSPLTHIIRPRQPKYGPAVREALKTAWSAANFICAKRLVPFLPELIPGLERHGHLTLTDQVRSQLLAISPATADRILRQVRAADRPHGISTTKAGKLLKHQVPVRTFTEWNDVKPGFMEIDLVAHCGNAAEGSFIYTLTLTDVATGWTECQALLHRSQHMVIQALDRARLLLPFPLLGIDSDNGGEFINAELIAYCEREKITFTRGRPYKKNDQCFVEQKNGAVVRQLIGYDRFEGENSYRQLAELYRAARLYVNFFQPSMKLLMKQRNGSAVYRKYDAAQTPLQRLLAAQVLSPAGSSRLNEVMTALDPVRLLSQLQTLQDALWKQALIPRTTAPVVEVKVGENAATSPDKAITPSVQTVRFEAKSCLAAFSRVVTGDNELSLQPLEVVLEPDQGKRKYHRTKKPVEPRTYRTRPDPFAEVQAELKEWLMASPGSTVKSIFQKLQARYPDKFSDVQLRTLQRHMKDWRAALVIEFDDSWLREDADLSSGLPGALRASELSAVITSGK